MVTKRAQGQRMVIALCIAPSFLLGACSMSGSAQTSAVDAPPPSQPAPSRTPLDPGRMQAIDAGLTAVNGDPALQAASGNLRTNSARLRLTGASAPMAAKPLTDPRVVRPKNCAGIRPAVAHADDVLRDGNAAVSATRSNV